ncbi:hypothetical protein ACS5PU_21155 [Pedobacter sp. GSP4]|uniref:hypothetical protein n=1 Tax=Pedobacter sp. GSP4 TaxID=3453716 RepID=UPI003EEEE0E7
MDDELLNFKQIIDNQLYNTAAQHQDVGMLVKEMKLQSAKLLTSIQKNISDLEPAKGRQYILQYQKTLAQLLTELEKLTEDACLSLPVKTSSLEIFIQTSAQLIADLEYYFPHYFDYGAVLPKCTLNCFNTKLKTKISDLQVKLETRGVDIETLQFFRTLSKSLISENKAINYQQKIYLENFLDEFNTQLQTIDGLPEILDVILITVSLNFNHPAVYYFCCAYFNQEMDKCESISQQYKMLNFLKKTFKQIFSLSASSYNSSLPAINESLQRYIEAELDYMKSLEITADDLRANGLMDHNFKVTFTVRQLAIFIHLQVEAKIIESQSPKVLHSYITKHYSTVEQENISEKSFKNAYYGNVGKDVEKVIDKIAIMLALAQEKY